jgi:hypothetical protein
VSFAETTKCLRCLRPATIHAGHVLKGEQVVLAGWCIRCIEQIPRSDLMKTRACYGGWHRAYGLRKP